MATLSNNETCAMCGGVNTGPADAAPSDAVRYSMCRGCASRANEALSLGALGRMYGDGIADLLLRAIVLSSRDGKAAAA